VASRPWRRTRVLDVRAERSSFLVCVCSVLTARGSCFVVAARRLSLAVEPSACAPCVRTGSGGAATWLLRWRLNSCSDSAALVFRRTGGIVAEEPLVWWVRESTRALDDAGISRVFSGQGLYRLGPSPMLWFCGSPCLEDPMTYWAEPTRFPFGPVAGLALVFGVSDICATPMRLTAHVLVPAEAESSCP